MKLVPTILALLVLAPAATAEEVIAYSVPEGADASRVATLLGRYSDWPDTPDMKGLRRQTRQHHFTHSKGQIRLRLSAALSDPELVILDEVVRRCYERYRQESLESIQENRASHELDRRRAAEVRARMQHLYETGEGVLDKEKALAASAERVEELRRRTVDAGIEVAVIEARLRAFRDQVERRRLVLGEARLAPLRTELARLLEVERLGPQHGKVQAVKAAIQAAEQSLPPYDDVVERQLGRIADLEVEQIATEERIKALSVALRSARELGGKLLDAVDLSKFRREVVDRADAQVRQGEEFLESLGPELRAVESDAVPERLPPGEDR